MIILIKNSYNKRDSIKKALNKISLETILKFCIFLHLKIFIYYFATTMHVYFNHVINLCFYTFDSMKFSKDSLK
jgi:hypothetical protein